MGTRNARLLAFSALALALACSDTAPVAPPALDRFYYPTGLAIRHVPVDCVGGAAGCQTQLIVVSSNFDLRFDGATGGTVIAVDVGQALAAAPLAPLQPPARIGVTRIGSFGGEVAILDERTCPGWETTLQRVPQALVASRSQNILYRVDLDFGSDPQQVPLEGSFGDPYGVTVACGDFGNGSKQFAFVTYLRTPNSEGQLSRIDLADDTRTQIDVGAAAPAHGTVFDASNARLYVTQRFAQSGFSPLRWLSLVNSETPLTLNIYSLIRGAELRGIALSSEAPPSRAYLALRIFDADTAAATGLRPIGDVAGALVVMDLTPGPDGQPSGKFLNVVPIDRGASEIRVIPRAGLRDLVAVTSTDDNTVALYDDETGSVAKVFDICLGATGQTEPAPCAPGDPLTGRQPFGLAVEPLSNGNARLYVGSFDRSWVNVIEINPLAPAAGPVAAPAGLTGPAGWVRIGPERQ